MKRYHKEDRLLRLGAAHVTHMEGYGSDAHSVFIRWELYDLNDPSLPNPSILAQAPSLRGAVAKLKRKMKKADHTIEFSRGVYIYSPLEGNQDTAHAASVDIHYTHLVEVEK